MNKAPTLLMARIVNDLVDGNCQKLVDEGQEERLKPEWLAEAVAEYPGKLTCPPLAAFATMEIYQIDGTGQAMAEFDLWVDGKPSDLTVQVLMNQPYEKQEYTIWDLHVM